MIDRFRRYRLRYDRVAYKEDAAQKIRAYFTKKYEPVQDTFLYYNGLELIIKEKNEKVNETEFAKRT
tara:strand:+ start:2264 stop:2464 length:201 start_codon:yes stop_codon:yes gene_type:complete